jgi:NADPH-dependent FMN reductase
MKPNDANGARPPAERPFRVLIISGSDRRQYDCPGADSKSRTLMFRMADRLPQEWEIDVEDLGNVWNREQIRTCNGCVSTSMALCVWPCNCYEKGSRSQRDLMWNLDLYSRLDLADAWAIIGPVNWYGPTSNLKAMFDRLVCMNGGNPREDLIEHKDPALAIQLEHAAEWQELSRNHLEGRTAAFFCYGDGGGDELDAAGRPKILEHAAWFDPDAEPFDDGRDYYGPLVWQCRYSGIEVPDELWRYAEFGVGDKYSDNQAEHMVQRPDVVRAFDAWTDAFARHVAGKGKVTPGRYRAYGYRPPPHLLADIKTKWRGLRMALGIPVRDTSPAIQQELELNRDATLQYKRGEGKKLRD